MSTETLKEWDTYNGFLFDGDARALGQGPGETIYCPGPLRLRLEPEHECYDDSYIDTWTDVSEEEREGYRADLWERIERDGVWILLGEFWDGREWIVAASCGGFIGDDWDRSGYDSDIMYETIRQWKAHFGNGSI